MIMNATCLRCGVLATGSVIGLLAGWWSTSTAFAAERIYNLVTAESTITISGTIDGTALGDLAIQQQGTNSLRTTYSGTIKTDRVANTIRFLGGSLIDANLLPGNWQPKAMGASGSEPADYAGQVASGLGLFAGRNFTGDIENASPLTITAGSFGLSTVDLTFLSGVVDYRISLLSLFDQNSIAGEVVDMSGNATLSKVGTIETLIIPVNANLMIDLDGNGIANLTFTGSLKATATVPLVPGDFDSDGDVDGADFVSWQTNFPKATGATLAQGDADGDLDVDGADFVVWQTNFPFARAAGASPVPEPGSVALLLIGAASATVVCRFRRRR